MNEFRIASKNKYLLRYLETYVLVNIPKVYSLYRHNIEDTVISINENTFRANINRGNIRSKYQKEILVNISMLDMYLSIILELDIIDKKRFMVVSRIINDIRNMVIGWKDSEEAR